ncbi:uncharacterized protein LOC103176098 isoform X6 [Callorhinchus milii]|uniref:uncharacterized protein LOC103176098 isoform X6 n=1 Tax=Callorhinchus milii TaxID=7868 RepID=UPI0004571FDE|nr:uncharacterized protein LOC103176098 isoform X6 [Callorhinchus milii]|eukprot:gi/632944755/ref/XP_007887676.1/ PREDICTED: uncharacterized protein LOC103176098 isoform X7 [Callorhinchus milii]
MTSAASQELKVDFILALLHDRGGKIKYAELVNMFETVLFQAAPDARDRNRKQFQDILSKVGFITEEERTKYVVLKPASDGAFGVEEETLSAFVDDSKRSVDTDFPDEAPANLLEWWVLDPSTRAGTEEALLEDEKDDRSSCIPFVVITQADEKETKSEMNKRDPWQDLNGDVESLKSESGSVGSEAAASVSIKGDTDQEGTDDDLQSITTSSVNSLFQRLQLDPLEHDWIRYAAMGNTAALTHLLLQDPTLASKKTFKYSYYMTGIQNRLVFKCLRLQLWGLYSIAYSSSSWPPTHHCAADQHIQCQTKHQGLLWEDATAVLERE